MTDTNARLPWDDAVLAMLTARLNTVHGKVGGMINAPAGVIGQDGRVTREHWILRPVPNGAVEVSLDDPLAIVELEYQFDAVGPTWRTSAWLADKAREVWLAKTGGSWTYPVESEAGYVVDRSVSLVGGTNSDAPGAYMTQDSYYLVVN